MRSVPGDMTGRGRRTTGGRSPSYHTRAGLRGNPGPRGAARASPRGSLSPAVPGHPLAGDEGPGRLCVPSQLGDLEDGPGVFPCTGKPRRRERRDFSLYSSPHCPTSETPSGTVGSQAGRALSRVRTRHKRPIPGHPSQPDPRFSGTCGSSQAPSHLEAPASSQPRVSHPRSATARWTVQAGAGGRNQRSPRRASRRIFSALHGDSRAWGLTYLVQLISPVTHKRQPAAASARRWQKQRLRRPQQWGPGLGYAPSVGRRIRTCAGAACSPPPCGRSLGLRLPAAALLPLTFQHLSPLGEPSRNPFHVNAPHSQWAHSGREPLTSGRGAEVLDSTASPRDGPRARSDRAAGQGLARGQWGHCFIRSLGTGARGQRHFPTEERVPLQPGGGVAGRLAKFPLPPQSPGRAKPSYTRRRGCSCIHPVPRSTFILHLSQGVHYFPITCGSQRGPRGIQNVFVSVLGGSALGLTSQL